MRIARRVPELPECWAPAMLINQLTRALKSCPEVPVPGDPPVETAERERFLRLRTDEAGWGHGEFCLPPEETAQLTTALGLARDAEFRDHNNLDLDVEVVSSGSVAWADALMRLADSGLDALDTTLGRTGHPGERTKIVLHHDIDPGGVPGPAQLHGGAVIPRRAQPLSPTHRGTPRPPLVRLELTPTPRAVGGDQTERASSQSWSSLVAVFQLRIVICWYSGVLTSLLMRLCARRALSRSK